jgi:endonuclease/exonuclease/phosphatase family metal-dependent hydrolase
MLRVATFNIENLDSDEDDRNPSLAQRIPVLQKVLKRLNADILCLQEVHGQELPEHTSQNPKRALLALDEVIKDTPYQHFQQAHTVTSDNVVYDKRNLVILSRYPIERFQQYRNDKIDKLQYRKVTADPAEPQAKDLGWERPILHAEIMHPELGKLHIINLHLKSRLASNIAGQKVDNYTWANPSAWAEGYFLSSIKRVGQALETRTLIDELFNEDINAHVIVCGDFNAEPGEVPVEAICGRVENTNNAALRDRSLIACSHSIAESIKYSHLHHGEGNLLDHILISQSLLARLEQALIHNENLHDESLPFTFDTKYPESDHAAFIASFTTA